METTVPWLLLLTACISGVLKDQDADDETDVTDTDVADTDVWGDSAGEHTDLPDWVDPLATKPLIVELCNTGDEVSSFVELANPTTKRLNLDGWTLQRFSGTVRTPVASSSLDGIVIPPGSTFVLTTIGGEDDFETSWGDRADDALSVIGGSGTDSFGLYEGVALVDLYGALGVDGRTQPWKYVDTCSRRKASVTAPKKSWDASQWDVQVWPGEPFAR